jgi:hypothetical protein
MKSEDISELGEADRPNYRRYDFTSKSAQSSVDLENMYF